jgi:hypothetical protein
MTMHLRSATYVYTMRTDHIEPVLHGEVTYFSKACDLLGFASVMASISLDLPVVSGASKPRSKRSCVVPCTYAAGHGEGRCSTIAPPNTSGRVQPA